MALRVKPILRVRGLLANARGFKITLQASGAEVRPGDSVTFTAAFTYGERPVPDAKVRLYINEALVSEERTGWDGTLSTSRIFDQRGTYNVIARYENPLLLVESNAVTVKAGYTLIMEQPLEGTVTPAPGTYPYQVEDVSAWASSLDHWEIDGVNAGSANPIPVVMDRDHVVEAVPAVRVMITVRLTWTGFKPPVAKPNTGFPVVWNAYLTPPGATEPYGQVNVYNFNPNTGQASGTKQLEGPAGSWHAVIVFWVDEVHGAVFADKTINVPASATISYDYYTGVWSLR